MELNIHHFSPSEFRGWSMCALLVAMLDELRDRSGYSIQISPVNGAIGRHAGITSHSEHNVDVQPNHEVRGIDVLVRNKGEALTKSQATKFIALAKAIGFTGIGVYPYWNPIPGFHLGCRRLNKEGQATWGDVGKGGDHVYTGLEDALAKWPE